MCIRIKPQRMLTVRSSALKVIPTKTITVGSLSYLEDTTDYYFVKSM